MTSKSHRDIAAILPAYGFSQFATIADIAGGRGHLLRAILKSSPKTQGICSISRTWWQRWLRKRGKTHCGRWQFLHRLYAQADGYLLMNVITTGLTQNPSKSYRRSGALCRSAREC